MSTEPSLLDSHSRSKSGTPAVLGTSRTPEEHLGTDPLEPFHSHDGTRCLTPRIAAPLPMAAVRYRDQHIADPAATDRDIKAFLASSWHTAAAPGPGGAAEVGEPEVGQCMPGFDEHVGIRLRGKTDDLTIGGDSLEYASQSFDVTAHRLPDNEVAGRRGRTQARL